MLHDIPKPEISPDFTIDDIHKIREWHYEILKDATFEERNAFYREGALLAQVEITQRKKERQLTTA